MKKLLLSGVIVFLQIALFCSGTKAQNNIEIVPEGSQIVISAPDSKIQSDITQAGNPEQKDNALTIKKHREQEIHVLIKAKKTELENSTDESRKATLNDEIQQLQDELQIMLNPPIEMKPEDLKTPDQK